MIFPRVAGGGDRPISEIDAVPDDLSVRVVSAVDIPSDQKERLEALLLDTYGHTGTIEYRVDAAVIGGVAMSIGDLVIDNTIRRQLSVADKHLNSQTLMDNLIRTDETDE